MKVTTLDKIVLLGSIYASLHLFFGFKKKMSLILRPLDAPRYVEFAYLRKFIEQNNLHDLNILDISSPYIMSYLLSKGNKVLKTDIDSTEKRFINENNSLSFKLEDATQLSFSDSTFNMTYSVSVIEHIYDKYMLAIQEMIRVTKNGGYVYLTFPVSKKYVEEWVVGDVYEKQYKNKYKTFFQYRFDEKHVKNIINGIKNAEVVHRDIFWEAKDGMYDNLIKRIKEERGNIYINFIKNVLVNIWYGFVLFPKDPVPDFLNAKSFGNIHLVLRKKS